MLNLHLHLSLTAVSPVGRIANRTTLYLDGSTSKGVFLSYFRNRPNVQSGLVRIPRPCLAPMNNRISARDVRKAASVAGVNLLNRRQELRILSSTSFYLL